MMQAWQMSWHNPEAAGIAGLYTVLSYYETKTSG